MQEYTGVTEEAVKSTEEEKKEVQCLRRKRLDLDQATRKMDRLLVKQRLKWTDHNCVYSDHFIGFKQALDSIGTKGRGKIWGCMTSPRNGSSWSKISTSKSMNGDKPSRKAANGMGQGDHESKTKVHVHTKLIQLRIRNSNGFRANRLVILLILDY